MTNQFPEQSSCEVILLTALPVEFHAVMRHLRDVQEIVHPSGTIYHQGTFPGVHRVWRIAVAEIGMGGMAAAVEAEKAIHFFHAQIAFFVGVAGGLKDVHLGDVVVATKVYAYEAGKAGQRFEPRPSLGHSSHELEQRARTEAYKGEWLARLEGTCPDPAPQVHIGALAAGEKVLSSKKSSLVRLLKTTYGDGLAIEMEGHGFLHAVRLNHAAYGLVIRGISDLVEGKAAADSSGMQIIAANHAAAFAFQVLATFTLPPSGGTLSPLTHRAIWNMPYRRNPYFTGRDDLLDRLAQQLSPKPQDDRTTSRRTVLTQPRAIKGLGGIGKTQIAVEYAYRSRDARRYTHTFWINAANEETIIASFVEMAPLILSLPEKDEADQHKLIAAIIRWLEECEQQWLLIFDNADDLNILSGYLPKHGDGSILLTTRSDADFPQATSIEVEDLSLMEGTKLLLHRARRFDHAVRILEGDNATYMVIDEATHLVIDEATQLAIVLNQFPLALDQAGAYINEIKCGFTDYLQMYLKHSKELLARRGLQATDYPNSVAITWSLSFQRIEEANPAAAQFLHLCAFLAPDRIPVELIKDGAAHWPPLLQQAAIDLYACNQMIGELLKFSLVKRLTDTETLSIHRMVQTVQKDMMELEKKRQWAEKVIRAVNELFPKNPRDIAVWPQCLRYLDQAKVCYELVEQYLFSFVEAASMFNRAGWYLKKHALYTIAEPLYGRALEIYKQQLGADHPNTAASLNNLATLYQDQGKYAEAEPLFKQALKIHEQQLGASYPDIAQIINNLATLYYIQGKYDKAEPLFKRALTIRKDQLGASHSDTVQTLDNLAALYLRQGKYAEAESLFKQTLANREQLLGDMHPDTAISFNNLAMLYRDQGKYAEAEPLFKQALKIHEQQLGATHPKTAQSIDNLAALYYIQGKYAEAEPLFRQALSIKEAQLGASHPNTAQNGENLAALYYIQEKYAEAEPLFRQALSIKKAQLGARHPDTAISLNNLGMLYYMQHKYSKAEPLLKRALAIRKQKLGASHPDTAQSLSNLGMLYQDQGKYAEAESLYQQALTIREQMLRANHPDTAISLNNLATLYREQGKYAKAEPLLKRALTIYEQQLGTGHPTTQTIQANYTALLNTMKSEGEADS